MSATSCYVWRISYSLITQVPLDILEVETSEKRVQYLVHFETPLIFVVSLTNEYSFFHSNAIFLMFIFRVSFPCLAARVPRLSYNLFFFHRSILDLPYYLVYFLDFPVRFSLIFYFLIHIIWGVLFGVSYACFFPAGLC